MFWDMVKILEKISENMDRFRLHNVQLHFSTSVFKEENVRRSVKRKKDLIINQNIINQNVMTCKVILNILLLIIIPTVIGTKSSHCKYYPDVWENFLIQTAPYQKWGRLQSIPSHPADFSTGWVLQFFRATIHSVFQSNLFCFEMRIRHHPFAFEFSLFTFSPSWLMSHLICVWYTSANEMKTLMDVRSPNNFLLYADYDSLFLFELFTALISNKFLTF